MAQFMTADSASSLLIFAVTCIFAVIGWAIRSQMKQTKTDDRIIDLEKDVASQRGELKAYANIQNGHDKAMALLNQNIKFMDEKMSDMGNKLDKLISQRNRPNT